MKKLHGKSRWILTAAAIAAALFCLLRMVVIEPSMLVKKSSLMPVENLPRELEGFSIMLVSDTHFRNGERRRMEKIHRAAEELKPDMIVLLGDYRCLSFDGEKAVSDEDMAYFFSGFAAPHGVFAVFGNHDFWHSRSSLRRAAAGTNVRFLKSQWVKTAVGESGFMLFGADDFKTSDRAAALPPPPAEGENMTKLLFCHNPDTFVKYQDVKFDAAFAGHLHGGQICMPWGTSLLGTIYSGSFFESGINEHNGRKLYMTSGAGGERFFYRWNCPPEVVLIKLCRPEKCPDLPIHKPVIRPEKSKNEMPS